jgi:hypothetical protein
VRGIVQWACADNGQMPFQDADESAYYEFLCRAAGIGVRYCAEEFENT